MNQITITTQTITPYVNLDLLMNSEEKRNQTIVSRSNDYMRRIKKQCIWTEEELSEYSLSELAIVFYGNQEVNGTSAQ